MLLYLLVNFIVCMVLSEESTLDIFSDVTTSQDHRYNLLDDEGIQMACLHVQKAKSNIWGEGHNYWGLYHAYIDSKAEYDVRLASSIDLINWKYQRTLISNADMPFPSRPESMMSEDGWIIVAHEQWINSKSQLPSQLGFKLYRNESELLRGDHYDSYLAPLSVGLSSKLEGTPSFYTIDKVEDHIEAQIGFHFNDENGVDQVASAYLHNFGGIEETFIDKQASSDSYNNLFIENGAVGNIGQRESGIVLGTRLIAQEANIGPMPPTIWEDWRVWLYFYATGEGAIPTGQSNEVEMINLKTHGGSTAFGNPSFTILECPPGYLHEACIFISYFIFSEGAAQGEAGVCVFIKTIQT